MGTLLYTFIAITFPIPPGPRVVISVRALSMGQVEQFGWMVGCFVLRRINPFGSFNAELNFKSVYHKYWFLFRHSLMSKQFHFKQFSLVLFDPKIVLYQVLPLRARVDLGAMAMKGYSALPNAPALLEFYHQIV